uniref:Uncharacterized protein LOC111122368 isoform X6 n=1 Tax=Crassostrea virginica TaxID=6565 RepID=A0A8B8CX71_CRAVI|nr:uncharacterized protein LOC111122368 isoform X6 [Crassostrea virginica]
MCAAMVDRNAEYPDYGRPMYDSQPQNDYGRQSYDYNRPTYDSYQQPVDYNRSSYDAPRGQDYPPYQTSSDPPVPGDLQITSGLVSLSDEKAKERRHMIQMEMRKEYMDHMRRQKPVYFTTGGPDEGLPIGNYSQARKVLDQERHRDYNRFIKEKEEQASRRRDEMMHQQQVMPPPPTNQTEMYDHNQMSQQLREERRKEYNDYLKLKETLEHESTVRPITPPGGLAIGGYEVYRNQLKRDRVREYRESLLKKEVNGTPRAPPTPPVGLNIPTEAERHKIAELKKRHYRDELLRQQKEQILNRAQHQLEIPVIDRRQANPDPLLPSTLPRTAHPQGDGTPSLINKAVLVR